MWSRTGTLSSMMWRIILKYWGHAVVMLGMGLLIGAWIDRDAGVWAGIAVIGMGVVLVALNVVREQRRKPSRR